MALKRKKTIVIHSIRCWLYQTGTWLYNQVCYLPANVESHVACEKTINLDQFEVPNIHSMQAHSRWQYFHVRVARKLGLRPKNTFLYRRAMSIRPDVLHSHFGPVAWENLPIAKRAGRRHVVTFYGFEVNRLPQDCQHWYRRYRELFAEVDGVLCEGPHMAQSIIDLGCPKEKVRVHHLGVAVDKITCQPREWSPGEPLRVLIASSFREKKGIPYALQALSILQNDIPLEVTIIGDAPRWQRHSQERHKILEIIQAGRLEPKVRLLGYQPHSVLFDEAYRHHVFLSPSVTASDGDTEGGAPVSIIEMAATGMPIVSTTHCDIPEVIRHGETGLLAPERDVGSLIDHLRWLTANPDQWRPMVEAGRKHIELEYDARKQGERLAAYYHWLEDTT